MQIALDENGVRVLAENSVQGNKYNCPICNKEVILRKGKINIAHFSHKANECDDRWNYDMSEWHLSMQSRFPESCREVVVKDSGEVHRADILYNDMVIEFQHSPISYDEILERNTFYTNAGYRIAWVFDLQEPYFNGDIIDMDNGTDALLYRWSYAKKVLKCFPKPSEYNSSVVLFFYWVSEDDQEWFNRVIWSTHNDEGQPDFKRFIVSNHDFVLNDDTNDLVVEDFFINKGSALKKHLSNLKYKYAIKYSGVKGKKQQDYICPRTGVFGLKRSGERACCYCKYCSVIEGIPKGFKAYCCYPNQVNEVNEGHPGYECSEIPRF